MTEDHDTPQPPEDYESRAVALIVEARQKAAAKTEPATEKEPAK